MVVRKSYSQLPHCPVLTQWRPSVPTQHSVQIFSEGSEKSEWQILHSEIHKENQLVWVIPELSTLTSEQCCSYSGAATVENSKVNPLCGWRERGQVPQWGRAGGYHRLRINPCPLHRALCHALPGLPWHRPGLNQALAYPSCCRCLWVFLLNTSKRCLSQRRVYTFSILWLSNISLDLKFPPQQAVILRRYSLVGRRGI